MNLKVAFKVYVQRFGRRTFLKFKKIGKLLQIFGRKCFLEQSEISKLLQNEEKIFRRSM